MVLIAWKEGNSYIKNPSPKPGPLVWLSRGSVGSNTSCTERCLVSVCAMKATSQLSVQPRRMAVQVAPCPQAQSLRYCQPFAQVARPENPL